LDEVNDVATRAGWFESFVGEKGFACVRRWFPQA